METKEQIELVPEVNLFVSGTAEKFVLFFTRSPSLSAYLCFYPYPLTEGG